MKRQAVPLLIVPTSGEDHILIVPKGECVYWSSVVNRHLESEIMGMDWLAEKPNVPYLGLVTLPSDEMAKTWLADHHATREASE